MAGTAPADGQNGKQLGEWAAPPPPAEAAAAAALTPSDGQPSMLKGSPVEPVAAHFVQQSWARRFGAQFAALFKKNLLVQWRSLRSTILRVLAPLFFMLLLYLVDLALTADNPLQVEQWGGCILPACHAYPCVHAGMPCACPALHSTRSPAQATCAFHARSAPPPLP